MSRIITTLTTTVDTLSKALAEATKPEMIYNYIDTNMPGWARPTIQKLTGRQILQGDEHGKLGLTDDMLRILVMLDRTGTFG